MVSLGALVIRRKLELLSKQREETLLGDSLTLNWVLLSTTFNKTTIATRFSFTTSTPLSTIIYAHLVFDEIRKRKTVIGGTRRYFCSLAQMSVRRGGRSPPSVSRGHSTERPTTGLTPGTHRPSLGLAPRGTAVSPHPPGSSAG
jgi:hypothetical protein